MNINIMNFLKFVVYTLLLLQCLVKFKAATADELELSKYINVRKNNGITKEDALQPKISTTRYMPLNKKVHQTSTNSSLSSNKDDNGFHFLVYGGYRIENNPLLKYLVSLRFKKDRKFFGDTHFCGGSIISEKVILTAAHCLIHNDFKLTPKKLKVIVGTPRRLVKTDNTQEMLVDKVIPHPKYGIGPPFSHDIALIKLKEEIRLSDQFASIIPINDQDPIGMKCTVIGWGCISDKGPLPDEALSGDVIINSHAYCESVAKTKILGMTISLYRKGMICASHPTDKEVDSSKGDSGGPLICDGKVVGIVSFGVINKNPKVAVYTDVDYFRDWISRNSACCPILQLPSCCMFLPIISVILTSILKRHI